MRFDRRARRNKPGRQGALFSVAFFYKHLDDLIVTQTLNIPYEGNLFGLPVKASGEGLTLNAMRFTVADLAQTEALFRQHEIACQRRGERLIVPPEEAFGATLIFEAAKVG